MEYSIEQIAEKKLIGKKKLMSFAENATAELWKNFMPQRYEIVEPIGKELYALQCYPPLFFEEFNVQRVFEKWAALEVGNFQFIPFEMDTFTLPAGLYAVFKYKGPGGSPIPFQYIFHTWLPQSAYVLDHRPHFEVLGESYKNNDPDSEEEIWIPVKEKE